MQSSSDALFDYGPLYDHDDEIITPNGRLRELSFVIFDVLLLLYIRASYYDDTASREKRVETIMKRRKKNVFIIFAPSGVEGNKRIIRRVWKEAGVRVRR